MQIVLSGNRVIAYGDNCFLAMGGTVICEETGKAYSNATVAEVDVLPADIDRVGYEYHAGIFVPCAPYGMDNGNGTILVACEDCKTPKDSGLRIDEIIGARLYVTAPAGCEVICTNGDKTVKGIYKNGVYVCNLTDYGEWTVTAGRWHGLVYESGSDTVTVDIVKQYTLSLGATISVEYPKGSTVTCTHGDVVLTAPDTSGVWELDVLAFGEWELYCTNGTDETSRKFTVSTGGQTETIMLAYFAAYIEVTYPANSTCTCSDGTTTFTDTNSADAEKTATFTVPNKGKWTITATANDGSGNSQSETVEITTEGQSAKVELAYGLYICKDGKWLNGFAFKACSSTWGAPTINNTAEPPTASGTTGQGVYIEGIDVTGKNTLVITSSAKSPGNSGFEVISWFYYGLSKANDSNWYDNETTNMVAYKNEEIIEYADSTGFNEKTVSIDVSSLSGIYWFKAYWYGSCTFSLYELKLV